MDTVQTDAAPVAGTTNRFYYLAWRWHFYAGLYVAPFLIMLATTGLIMLWISMLAGVGGDRVTVTPGTTPMAVSALQSAAEATVPGDGPATQYVEPRDAGHGAVFAVNGADGSVGVVINPYTAEVLKTFAWRAGWYDFATDIHGSLLLGTFGDRLIEIAASLGVVLVVSGLYLHWPRKGAQHGFAVPRLAARGRSLWRSIHGVTGLWVSLILMAFLVSGLSWAGIWGDRMVQAWSTFPAQKWDAVPLSDATHASMNHGAAKEVPWGLEKTPMPASGSLAGAAAIDGPVEIDSVVAFARSLGMVDRFQINLPSGATGVWTISHDSMSNDGPNPAADRTIHIDRHTGNVLADVRYADYSAYAKAMAWGIALHEGDMGAWNVALNTLFCLAILLMSVSGLVMWWKRRPQGAGRLAAPPRPRDLPLWKGAVAILVVLGVMFPLAGLTLLAVVVLDATLLRLMPGLKRALS